jgi:sugar transferase EpsL
LKRFLDVFLGTLLLVLCVPSAATVAVAVRLRMGPPVLFRQKRPGLDGKLFTLYKFRTMSTGPGTDAARLTPLGRLLRRFSLDELPQLVNVLRGDMSLVGPRPLLPEYLDLYTPTQAQRHDVKPGLTGWAQIHGRNALSWPRRLALDVWYVKHRSLRLDVRILVRTLWQLLDGHGVRQPGHATAERLTAEHLRHKPPDTTPPSP